MNFFKSLQSQVNAIPNMGRNIQPKRNNDFIVDLIRSCTYPDDVKFAIEKSVRQVLHVYPQYIVDKIEFAEHNNQKRYIQLKGQISVDFRGNVALFIMYPVTFPKTPPFLRILNPNPQQLTVNPYYKKYQSKTDSRSYLLNDCLQEAKSWKQSSSVASIIIEVNDIVRTNFPFQPSNQFGNQNQMYQQQGYNPNYYNQNNPSLQKNSSWGHPQHAKQPPIPFKTSSSSAQVIPKGQKFITSQKAKLAEIKKHHQSVLPVLQTLDVDRKAMESECQKMSKQSEKMIEFMNHSEEHEVNNFASLVTPADEVSESVLNYVASIKAREDTIHLLESKFNQESISLEDFLKNIRKLEQSKFADRFMLHQTLQSYSHVKEF